MNLFRNATLIGALIITQTQAHAQQIAIKESTAKVKGPEHVLLPCAGGDYITITYPFADDNDPLIVSRFDHTLNETYTNTIAETKKTHYRSCLYTKGHLAVLCTNKDGDVSRYDIDEKTGALAGAPTSLFTLEAKEDETKFFAGNAPNRNYFYFVSRQQSKKEKGTVLQGTILDQQYGKLATFTFQTPEDRQDFSHSSFVQSDDGTLYMIYSASHAFKVVTVDVRGATHTFPMNGIPEGNLSDLAWTIDGSRLSFTGLIAHAQKKGYTTVFTGSIDFQKKKGGFHQTELGTLIAKAPDYMQGLKDNGIPTDAAIIRTLRLGDGSHILVLEDRGNYNYQSHYAPMSTSNPGFSAAPASLRMGTMTSYSITYYNRGNIYLIKTDNNNVPQWANIITKNQREPDMALAIGTACTVDSKDNIHVFFIDNKKNKDVDRKSPKEVNGMDHKKNKLACVTIDPAGAMTKQLMDIDEPKYRPILEKSVGDEPSEICFMAIKKKTAFTIDHMLNHADYHLGIITVAPNAAPSLATQ